MGVGDLIVRVVRVGFLEEVVLKQHLNEEEEQGEGKAVQAVRTANAKTPE